MSAVFRAAVRRMPTPTSRPRNVASARWNSSVHVTPQSPTPVQQLYALREIDRLTTSIAKSSPADMKHPSPLVMRALPAPWLSSSSPDLASQGVTGSASNGTGASYTEMDDDALKPRHMSESFTSFDLPLASDKKLYERYVNTSGGFRMGKLLEHLDSLAGAVAYRHCLPAPETNSAEAFHEASAKAGLYLATASADRLDMFGRLNRDNVRDLKFSGFVTWTGRSSMEVVVKMEGSRVNTTDTNWKTLMLGRFAMVCRDSKSHKARMIPPLVVESEEERILQVIGDEHQKRRRTSAMNALDKVPPSFEEANELHDLMLQVTDNKSTEIDGETVVRMKDTEMETVQLMHPQDRNLHGKVFGGILMRLLCFTNAALFASKPLRFLSLDQITFRLPVPIGAVLRLSSKVVKTTKPHDGPDGEAKVHIMVKAEVEEVETGVRRETNTFFFTMAKDDHEPVGKVVVPRTYKEAMHYLEGSRRLELGNEMRRLYQGESN
ncbi:hypothetical protein IAR55_000900 [Kwoniella newhampshirensis]|uniref:HotDog ACOT-type domain-containing protein n=1 Tax=Kwoniella newhampshirensis TaxID=1651941 RepID=A0AAW0Z471_9TREE